MKQEQRYQEFLKNVICYLDSHYNEVVRLEDLVRGSYLDKDYFRQLFKAYTGKNITQYIQEKRMEEAIRLLVATNKSVGEIAVQCGYCDLSHFYSKFRQVTGSTPARFRQNSKHI